MKTVSELISEGRKLRTSRKGQKITRQWAKRGSEDAAMNRAYDVAQYLAKRGQRSGAKWEQWSVNHDYFKNGKRRTSPVVKNKETGEERSFKPKYYPKKKK